MRRMDRVPPAGGEGRDGVGQWRLEGPVLLNRPRAPIQSSGEGWRVRRPTAACAFPGGGITSGTVFGVDPVPEFAFLQLPRDNRSGAGVVGRGSLKRIQSQVGFPGFGVETVAGKDTCRPESGRTSRL
jgi:hypothetical protein